MSFFITDAWAQAAGAQQGGGLMSLLPLIAIFVVFYFLLIRPQQKRNKEHKEMITNLKKGDRIITNGGIYGRITGLDETTLTVEIADRVRVKVVRGNVSALAQSAAPAAPAKKEKDKGSADKS